MKQIRISFSADMLSKHSLYMMLFKILINVSVINSFLGLNEQNEQTKPNLC